MARKTETITLSIQKGTKEKLEHIADRLGIYWGDRPSISGLLNAIATKEVYVGKPFELNSSQVKALEQVVKALVDSGQMQSANIVVELLLERGKIETPMRDKLLNQISHEQEGWRKAIDYHLRKREPFLLIYENNQEEQKFFNVCYGEIRFHEKRFYLDAWCEETNPNADIAKLSHNYCFRFDRIKNILKSNRNWREEGLDFIEVTLNFYAHMIKAYESKLEDIDVSREDDKLVVLRKVSNPFWLIREVLPYGQNCEIISPSIVRDKFRRELEKISSLYW
jgi:predicted DNA-binding transcriptional regulator YafY